MGMDRTVRFPGAVPEYPAVRDLLAKHSMPVQVRMIDGQLAFPDEMPGPDWQELRLGTAAGMVTVRRTGAEIACVTWGNADAGALQLWNAIAWAFAAAGAGEVLGPGGPLSAADFARSVNLSTGQEPQP